MARYELFLSRMEERQRIYLLRQSGAPFPWTKDPIFQQYRFCNCYREQDTQTTWLRENWITPYADHPYLWFACAMFRMINLSDTAEEIGFPRTWEPRTVQYIMEHRAKRGHKVFNGAYLIRSLRNGKGIKPYSIVWDVLNPLWEAVTNHCLIFEPDSTLESVHKWLMGFPGWGGFMAYEVVTDLRHTRYLCNAPDIYSWANAGPGAIRGLNRIFGRPTTKGMTPARALELMQRLFAYVDKHRNRDILPTLEMRDIEMWLCEMDKYLRVKQALKEGRRTGLDKFRIPKTPLI